MSATSPSSFAQPDPGLRIKEGVPPIPRPKREDVPLFQKEAKDLMAETWSAQKSFLDSEKYDLNLLAGKHFILAGATGPGLGGALACAVLNLLGDSGSVTVVSRDPMRSLGHETGVFMRALAEEKGLENRFQWLNSGLAIEGDKLESVISAVKDAGADTVIYINTVAAANSGILPGYPPIYIKDVDEEGLFQWKIPELDERSIESTKFIMGTMAVKFPDALENAGIRVEATAFADWRGSLDKGSRDPSTVDYGRNGAYSSSLYLPKDIIQEATASAYKNGKVVIDCFLPIMRTRALGFIPGGHTMAQAYDVLMKKEGVPRVDVPELALGMLQQIGLALEKDETNPFPRLDHHEAPYDLWFFEILRRMNEDENSEFCYKRWM